ncbi:MAG: transcription elongation factor GreA [Clostridia bacterium]|nr:transcription elongation factor GreA [Clostridia bacterium]
MEQKLYTPQGFKALQDELDYLINVKVEENKKEISKARAYGDLSENSEYDAAKQEQAVIHARIDELREMIVNAKVIDESQIDESRISVGSVVVLFNVERNREFTYHIVGSYETDPANGKISDSSPIGAALLGAREGEEVTVEGARVQHLRILSVSRAKEN